MTSPGQYDDSLVPNPAALAETDAGEATEQAINDALSLLDGIDELPVAEHVQRFEAVHTALTEALNTAENLLSGSNSSGS